MLRSLFRKVCLLCVLVLLAVSLQGQTQDKSSSLDTPPANAAKLQKKQPAKLKLTPEQEKALRLLDEAQASAPGLQPAMQTYVLFEVANTYGKFDKAKSAELIRQSFLASLSMDDDPEHCSVDAACVKGWMQRQILEAIMKDSPDEAEQQMVRAETIVRHYITGELVRKYVDAKNFNHAEDLLTQIADQLNYPYGVATTLILDFPKEQSVECQRVFNQAFANFNQYGTSGVIGTQDFGALILQTATRLPPQLVLEAIDKVLEEAKSNETMKNMHVTIDSRSNNVSLNSLYEMRLFQLLPVLQQIDSSRAESLLRDDVQMQNILKNNPDGMGAFEPGFKGKGEAPFGMSYSMNGDSGTNQFQAQEELEAEMERRQNEIKDEANQNPQQAIAEALALPTTGFGSPRAETLNMLAVNLIKKNQTAAKSALDELMKLADQLSDSQVRSLTRVPRLYMDLGDPDDAASAVKMLSKKAEAAYAKDNDADDPNQAFKGAWPSTILWQLCVKTAAKISPQLVHDVITGIPDTDIIAFEKLGYAKGLLGIDSEFSASVQHKNGPSFSADYGK